MHDIPSYAADPHKGHICVMVHLVLLGLLVAWKIGCYLVEARIGREAYRAKTSRLKTSFRRYWFGDFFG